MSKKSIEELSSEELYELAKQRAEEEQEQVKETARVRIEELREMRRELVAGHKKSIAAVDREIRELSKKLRIGGSAKTNSGTPSRGGRSGSASKQIVDIVRQHGPIAVTDLKQHLEELGLGTKNLNQQLAYLKRRGEIESPQRAVYTAK